MLYYLQVISEYRQSVECKYFYCLIFLSVVVQNMALKFHFCLLLIIVGITAYAQTGEYIGN